MFYFELTFIDKHGFNIQKILHIIQIKMRRLAKANVTLKQIDNNTQKRKKKTNVGVN